MNTLTCDSQSICINCCGIDYDFENRCKEIADISDDILTNYVKHRKQLKAKQRYKSKSKDPLLSASAIDDPAIVSNVPSSVDVLLVSVDVPSVDSSHGKVDAKLSLMENEIIDTVCSDRIHYLPLE